MSLSTAKKSREKSLRKLTEDIHARLNISDCLTFGSALRKYYDGTITETELNAEVESLLSHHPDLLQRFPIFTTSQRLKNTSNIRDDVTEETGFSPSNSFNYEASRENLGKACLHNLLCSYNPELEQVKRLLLLYPDAISEFDSDGKLPLHIACIRGASYEVIQALVDACPESISTSDNFGRIPLHYYVTFTNSDFTGSSFTTAIIDLYASKKFTRLSTEAITLLGANNFMMQEDHDGITPLNSFAYKCHLIGKRDQESYTKAKQLIDAFLESCPPIEGNFLYTIRAFPYGLLKHIANNIKTRERLNEQAIKTFFFGTIILDLVVRVVICILFVVVNGKIINDTNDGVHDQEHDDGILHLIYILYCGCVYLLIRVGTRFMSFLVVDDSCQWALDGWNWIQVIESVLLLISVILMHKNPEGHHKFKIIATVASGIQWVSVLAILKPASLQMVLFWKGLSKVVKTLVPFLISSAVILLAFTTMLFLTAQENNECRMEEDSYFPCTFEKAISTVMTNFANSEIDDESFHRDVEYGLLQLLFAMLVIILQLNILIAVVTDAFSSVRHEGRESFWLQRLYYTSEARHLKRFVTCFKEQPFSDSISVQIQDFMEKKWTEYTGIIFHRRKKQFAAYRKLGLKEETNLTKKILLTLKGYILISVLVVWVIVGFCTLGFFLPRQVKSYLFFEEVCDDKKGMESVISREEMLLTITKEIQKQITDTNDKLDLTFQKHMTDTSEKLDRFLISLRDTQSKRASK